MLIAHDSRRILTIIADYTLYPAAKFPQAVEDVRDALAWFILSPQTVIAASPAGPIPQDQFGLGKIFVMGHSAGANLITTLYLSPTLLPLTSPVRAATRGLVPQGGAYTFDLEAPAVPPDVLIGYYGSREAIVENQPITLLEKASDELVDGLPEIFALRSEREPALIGAGNDEFVKALEAKWGRVVKYESMKGHNHISPHWALLSGEGEEWGEAVAEWIKARV